MFAVLALFAFIVNTVQLQNQSIRVKRLNYYFICGGYPNQFYSIYPCNYNRPASLQYCSNGGFNLRIGCTFDYQCTPFSMHPTVCILGCCCTKPTTPTATTTPVDVNAFGYCYNGERSQMRCSSTSVCSSGQTCINGLCCKTTGEEWQNACAGLAALASCTNGTCGEFICTTSNYCCECQFGRTSGLCSKGCGPGFTCSPNNYCCPSCPSVDANKVHWSIVLAGAICILLAVYAGSKDQLLPLDNYGTQK
ncbi:hypothetical protein RB195_000539 [Necator americanus]|uniref:EB module n=1 Tax=Necator americanus TaxID=51031 RepID=A0ABR1DBZ0_NECAM